MQYSTRSLISAVKPCLLLLLPCTAQLGSGDQMRDILLSQCHITLDNRGDLIVVSTHSPILLLRSGQQLEP